MNVELLIAPENRWRDSLTHMAHDVFHRPEYAIIESRHQGGQAAAIYGIDAQGSEFLMPLLIRPLPPRLRLPESWQDATAPYGYPAPIASIDNPESLRSFLSSAAKLARENDIISLFLRWHPLLSLGSRMPIDGETIVNHGETVFIDLSESCEEWQQQTRSSHRRYATRLRKLGFQTSIDDWTQLAKFQDIYCQTMRRVGACEDYDRSVGYFQELRDSFGSQLHIASIVSPQGQLAASALFTECNGIAQYYLGGTAETHLHFAPTKLLFDDMRRWAKERGNRWLHLGGGVGGAHDSLFEFKAGFSRHRGTFYTSRIVTDPERFQTAVSTNQADETARESDFFPPYRRAA